MSTADIPEIRGIIQGLFYRGGHNKLQNAGSPQTEESDGIAGQELCLKLVGIGPEVLPEVEFLESTLDM